MPDNRDYRVKAYLFITNAGVALGLYNHVLGLKSIAVDINPDKPNAEMRYVALDNHYFVKFDLCFPPDKEDDARGLYNHTKNTPSQHSPTGETCYVSLEHCGHRINEPCKLLNIHLITNNVKGVL